MRDYLHLIDTQTSGPRCDVTPLFADANAFAQLVTDLAAPFRPLACDLVVGIDALGFILGTALALHLHTGFVPIRKAGKLPVPADVVEFVDYTHQRKALELRTQAIAVGQKVLLVDEWIETGAQMHAAIQLVERQGGLILGIAAINIDDAPLTRQLQERYRCHSVWKDMA